MIDQIEALLDDTPEQTPRALSQRDMNSLLENVALFRGCLDIVNVLSRTMLQRNVFLSADVESLNQELKNVQHVMGVAAIAFENFQLASQTSQGSA
jgi:hypothetical protein